MLRKTSSDIPRARQILNQALKGELEHRKAIIRALGLMTRRSADFRAPKQSKHLTKAQYKKIRTLRRKGLSQLAIANRYGVNSGRISETLNGKAH